MTKHQKTNHRKMHKDKKRGEIGHEAAHHAITHPMLRAQIQQVDAYLKNQTYLIDHESRPLVDAIIDYYSYTKSVNLKNALNQSFSVDERQRLDRGTSTMILIDKILNQEKLINKLTAIPIEIAMVIAKFIELLDLTKLPSLARVSYVTILLDDLDLRLENLCCIDTRGIVKELKTWKTEIQPTILDKLPFRKWEYVSPEKCEQLELDVSKWIADFKLKLANLDIDELVPENPEFVGLV